MPCPRTGGYEGIVLHTQPLPVLQTTLWGALRYRARHFRPSYEARALSTGAVVLLSLVASVSVLVVGVSDGLAGASTTGATAVVRVDPPGSASPSGSVILP